MSELLIVCLLIDKVMSISSTCPDSRPTDVELLQCVSSGDQESLNELYRRYSGILLSTAFRVLNNTRDSEDVLQEAFLQIWQKAARYDVRRGTPLTWAITVTRNKAIDRLRRLQRRHRLQEDLEQEADSSDDTITTNSADVAVARETQAMVRSAVIHLSTDQRRAIELAFFGGLTQSEIAQQLRQPIGTVKARIRRGMVKLRHIIEPRL